MTPDTKTEEPAATALPVPTDAEARTIFSKLKSVYISVFIDVIGIGLVIPVLPYLILSFEGAGASEVGLTIAVYSLCQIPGSLVFGYVSDKYGRRPVLLLSIASSALSFLLCGFATNLPFIIFARAISGLTGGSISVAQAYVADVTTVEERPKYLGLIGATIGIAFTFGPGIGAGTAAIMGAAGASVQQQYSAVFFMAAGFGFLGFLYAYKNLEESSTSDDKKKVAATKSDPTPQASLPTPIILVALAMFATNYAFTVMQSTYGVLIFEEWGWATAALGAILVVSGLEIAVLQGALIKRLVAKVGKHFAGFMSCVALGVGLAMLPLTLFNKPLHFFMFAVHVAGFSIGQTALPALLSRFASKDDQGKSLGLGQAFQAASRVAAPIISGYLFDYSNNIVGLDYAAPYLFGGLLSVLSGVPLLCLLSESRRGKGEEMVEGQEEEEGAGVELGAIVVKEAVTKL